MTIKILLIEDNPDHIEITKRYLQKTSDNYQLDLAIDGRSGLKKIFETRYDVILCDYRLPDLSAIEILKEMNKNLIDTPFIVATGLGNEKVAVDLMKEGAYDYIVKDIMYQDTLEMIIKKAIDRYRIRKEKEKLEMQVREAYERLKETQGQLIQAEKMNAVGQLASGVAHEVRNPLGIIMQGINFLENRVSDKSEGIPQTLAMIKESIKRADKIIDALFDFSRASVINLEPQDLNSILEVSLSLLQAEFKFDNIEVVMETNNGLPKILADKNKLEQVFINILLNAMQAMPKGGQIFVRSYEEKLMKAKIGVGRREGDYFNLEEKAVIAEIEDTGSGIPEANMRKIFDPFFTTKGPRDGAGLGLSVTKNIITMHKGLIEVTSKEGKGTKVLITLKIAGGESNG